MQIHLNVCTKQCSKSRVFVCNKLPKTWSYLELGLASLSWDSQSHLEHISRLQGSSGTHGQQGIRGLHSNTLTHWGRVTHICVSKQTIIGSDNGLSPGLRQAIIWTNTGISLIGTLETNFNEILIEIHKFSVKKIHFKMLSGKWRPFCLSLNMLRLQQSGWHLAEKISTSFCWKKNLMFWLKFH